MTEQQPYEVVREHPGFELGYIGGRNTQSRKVAMTAPVVQEAEGDTAGRFVVGFVMPADFDLRPVRPSVDAVVPTAQRGRRTCGGSS